MPEDRPLTITVDQHVLNHVLALALLGAQTYLKDPEHLEVADRDIDIVQREALSAAVGYTDVN